MTEGGGVILSADLEGFFHEQVSDARQSLGIELTDHLEYYLVNLLCDFSHRASAPLPGDEPLALLYKRALEAEMLERISLLKDLGDLSLYVSGFFEEYIERSLVDLNYYMSMGGNAYKSLGDLMGRQRSGRSVADVYRELADRFEHLVNVLNRVSDSSRERSNGDAELVKLYERWLETGDPRLHKQLLEKGLVTAYSSPSEYEQ